MFTCKTGRIKHSLCQNVLATVSKSLHPVGFYSLFIIALISCRAPHSKVQHVFKAGTCVIQTNVLPDMTGNDQNPISMMERLVCIQFPHSYVNDPELIAQNPDVYKQRDNTLKERFGTDLYRLAFISLLFEYYPQCRDVPVPSSVKNFVTDYFNGNSKKVENNAAVHMIDDDDI
jgi:hypothetical protein